MSRPAPANLVWRKSSRTNVNECVEVAWPGDVIVVRDSKDPSGPVLTFEHSRFGRLLASFGR